MATLQQLIEYSKKNPTSDIAKKTRQAIQSGAYDQEAATTGVDLTRYGRPTQNQGMATATPTEDVGGFGSTRLGQVAQEMVPEMEQRADRVGEILGREGVSPLKKGFQVFGQGAGLAASAIERTAEKLPIVRDITKTLGEGVGAVAGNPIVQAIGNKLGNSDLLQEVVSLYDSDPEFKDSVDAVANSVRLGADVEGAITTGNILESVSSKLASKAAPIVAEAGAGLAETGGNLVDEVKTVATNAKNKFVSALPDKSKMRSVFTNLDEQIFKRVENPEYAQKVKSVMDTLEAGDINPYLGLVQRIGDRVSEAWQNAKTNFSDTARKYVSQGEKYDVGARLPEIVSKVDAFKTGKDIKFDVVRNSNGQITGYKLTKGRYSPYTSEEINNLNRLIDDIMSARDINADELIALDQKFGSYYNAVNPSTPTPYHAAVMELKSATQDRIRNLLSGEMKGAYEQYSKVSSLREDFGNKVVDNQGNLKPTAEQYLANLTNRNKGVQQLNAQEYQDLLGIDVVNESQAIADAKKFMLTQAPSGGRLSDFLKSNVFTGLGAGAGSFAGPFGAGAGAAVGAGLGAKLTSPKFVGKRAIEEAIANRPPITNRVLNSIAEYMRNHKVGE